MGNHHALSPSKLPAWALCACYEPSTEERHDANEGTRQHAALAALLAGGETPPPAELSADALGAVQWAASYVRTLAAGDPVQSEVRLTYSAPDGWAAKGESAVYFGTADGLILHGNTADTIEYKSGDRQHDYKPQVGAYALALMSTRARVKVVRAHILYGRTRQTDCYSFTREEAGSIVFPIIEARQNPDRTPTPCEYCGLCGSRLTCPALTGRALAVAEVRDWREELPAMRDPAAISDPGIMARALTLAKFIETWADAVRSRATELARSGAMLPGFRLQERKGSREVTDLDAAFTRTGLTPGQFVSACKVSLPKLGDAFATARGLSKAAAGREVEAMLADLIREGTSTVSLVVDRRADV